ncbi:hypothetical protein BC962_3243 [Gillisia mitskevichiae]|uniref:Uncharacterized protein n=1 Tax=Gillisia mitskevichiae TaxID=270921 RepID=A0A495NZC9_9FLAO|nr:hypothetical protein [Gillisia mitskevichiae]RKS42518.1 hypothetical protein BC962_3243 [Gillisia mitskevichiae]
MKKISDYLLNDNIQRLLYGIGLVLWIIIWFSELKSMSENNSYAFYWWSVLTPIPLLIGQIIFNIKIIWTFLMIYVILYSLEIIWNIIMIDVIIDMERDFSPLPFWTFEKVYKWLIMIFILFTVNGIIWKIKPVRAK